MFRNIDTHSTNIKETVIPAGFPSVLSHNSVDIAADSNHIKDAAGVRYPAIVLQPTHTQWEQQKVNEKYPIIIPGIDEQPCEESQTVIGATRCNDCKTVEVKVEHCESWTCPVCGARKVRRQAKRIVERLKGFKDAINTSANPRHIVVSSKRWDGATLEQMTRNANNLFSRYLPELSGVYVIHMFRIRGWDSVAAAGTNERFNSADNIKKRLRDFRQLAKGKSDVVCPSDFWGMIRQDVLDLGSWREYVYVSPHIHIIGWGKLPNSKKFYADTGGKDGGIIYKTKEREGRSFDFFQAGGSFDFTSDILKTLYYLGGHAAIKKLDNERHANRIFRAFGFCSVYKLKETIDQDYKADREIRRVSETVIYDKKCPTCAGDNCVETRLRDIHNYNKASGFDDEYNPVDSEGNVLKDLIIPIHKFEWSWYHYHFAGFDVREQALKFAKKLPRRRELAGVSFEDMGRLERLVMIGLKGFDEWKNSNSSTSVVVEE